MNLRIRLLLFALAFSALAGGWRLISGGAEKAKVEPAAKVETVMKEERLNTITLTERAEQRLGVKVEPIAMKTVQRSRLYSGEIITPVGRRGVVTAPFGGLVKAPAEGLPKAGDTVRKGQIILILLQVLTAEARSATATAQVDADMQAGNAATQLQAAKVALERARTLHADGVGARRTVQEAQAVYDTAAKTMEAARARELLLEESLNEGTAAPIEVAAPEDGVLRKLSAANGQNVPGGTALFEMGDLTTAWVRVTLPVGDLEDIARDQEVQIGSLSAHASQPMRPAMPVSAPPLANPQTYTVDLIYVLHDSGEEAIPGRRVGVLTPVGRSKDSPTLPASAVVFDALGGSWVYEQTAPLTYARKRVTVDYIAGGNAVISGGPAVGANIVTVGAQAMFGAETGTMK